MRWRTILWSPWLVLRAQILLGVIFLYAALPKALDPPAFAKTIWAYSVVPGMMIPWLAIWLPLVELVVAICLLLGIWVRAAALWALALLSVFVIALGVNVVRGRSVDCGCFGGGASKTTPGQAIVRDIGLIILAAYVFRVAQGGHSENGNGTWS